MVININNSSISPPGGMQCFVTNMSVCFTVCLSGHSHNLKTTWLSFIRLLCMLPVAVTQSSSDVVAICYVLLVLWMTSCFHTMELMGQNQFARWWCQSGIKTTTGTVFV